MAEIFAIYNQQIINIMSKISNELNDIRNTVDNDTIVDSKLSRLEANIIECEKLIKTLEIQQVTGSKGSNLYLQVRNQANSLEQYKKRYNKERERIEEERKRKELLSSTDATTSKDDITKEQINNYSIAYNSFDNLEKAKRESIKMEVNGVEIIEHLSSQTHQMKNIGGKVNTMHGELTISTSLISEMDLHQHKNKRLLISLAVILLIVYLVIVAFRLIPSKGNYDRHPPHVVDINSNHTDNKIGKILYSNSINFEEEGRDLD